MLIVYGMCPFNVTFIMYSVQGLPDEGITVFASQLHTHLSGRRVRTMHIRNGLQLEDLNGDKHYSPHFQEIRLLQKPVKVLPVRYYWAARWDLYVCRVLGSMMKQ